MWLRFRTADLPADQGVALMSKEQLFVVGLRLMIIPLLVTGTIAALLAHSTMHERSRLPARWAALAAVGVLAALAAVWAFAVAGWPTGLAVLLDALVVVGALCLLATVTRRPERLPRWLAPATAAAAAALVLVLCLAVPALDVDDRFLVRLAVAAGALLAMALPLAVLGTRRLPQPRALVMWCVIGAAAVLISLIVARNWWARVAIVLGALVVAGVLAALALAQGRRPRVGGWVLPVLGIALVGLIVPWSFASATWPLGLALVVVAWLVRRDRPRLPAVMAATAVVAAAVVSIGRQLDEPVQLLHATVTFKDTFDRVEGTYVSASGDTVYLGDQEEGTIDAIPRSGVREVSVGPPDERAPSPSLLSRIIPGDDRFSVRPLEVWCDGEKYTWFEAGKVCRTQPRLHWTTRIHDRFLDRLGMPVRVRCPREARDVCRGWILLTSDADYLHGRGGIPRPVVPEPVPFAVGQGKTTEVCATLTAGQLRLLRRHATEKAVLFEAVVAHDPEGGTVLDRGAYGLLVSPARVGNLHADATECEPKLTIEAERATATVTARPRARGITPWHVEGWIRLTATSADGSEQRLPRQELMRGEADFDVELEPGTWLLTARYTAVTGMAYSEPRAEAIVEIPGPRRAARDRAPAQAPVEDRQR